MNLTSIVLPFLLLPVPEWKIYFGTIAAYYSEEEMDDKSWILSNAKQNHILPTKINNGNLWKQILTEMGGKYKMIANYPEHPSLN